MIERDGDVVYVTKPIGEISNCVEMRGKDFIEMIEILPHRVSITLLFGEVKGRGYCVRIENSKLVFHKTIKGDFRKLLKELKDMKPKEAFQYLRDRFMKLPIKN